MIGHSSIEDSKTSLGFWIYLMTDCILFASLFAAYIVLRGDVFGSSLGHELFNMPFVLLETMILLTSSFTCGLAIIAARNAKKPTLSLVMLGATFLLGVAFLVLELSEFRQLAVEGNGWQTSAYLSSFFTLVGTHGLHITVGLLWASVIAWQIASHGLTNSVVRRLVLFSLFWHFLDIIWIFIFTIVYLTGVI